MSGFSDSAELEPSLQQHGRSRTVPGLAQTVFLDLSEENIQNGDKKWPYGLMHIKKEATPDFSKWDISDAISDALNQTIYNEFAEDLAWEKINPPERWPERQKQKVERRQQLRRVGKALSNVHDKYQKDKGEAALALAAEKAKEFERAKLTEEAKRLEKTRELLNEFLEWLDRDENTHSYQACLPVLISLVGAFCLFQKDSDMDLTTVETVADDTHRQSDARTGDMSGDEVKAGARTRSESSNSIFSICKLSMLTVPASTPQNSLDSIQMYDWRQTEHRFCNTCIFEIVGEAHEWQEVCVSQASTRSMDSIELLTIGIPSEQLPSNQGPIRRRMDWYISPQPFIEAVKLVGEEGRKGEDLSVERDHLVEARSLGVISIES
ncbi:MAG: hypothetical protein Q9182_006874 [Xanthomendoza sp. 2 TL-2023]